MIYRSYTLFIGGLLNLYPRLESHASIMPWFGLFLSLILFFSLQMNEYRGKFCNRQGNSRKNYKKNMVLQGVYCVAQVFCTYCKWIWSFILTFSLHKLIWTNIRKLCYKAWIVQDWLSLSGHTFELRKPNYIKWVDSDYKMKLFELSLKVSPVTEEGLDIGRFFNNQSHH